MDLSSLPVQRLHLLYPLLAPGHSLPLQIGINLPIILTNVLSIPPITPTSVPIWCVRKRCFGPLQGYIARAHDRLSHVLETVVEVPRHVDQRGVRIDQKLVVAVEDGVETVQLVCHGGSKDGSVREVVQRVREVGI